MLAVGLATVVFWLLAGKPEASGPSTLSRSGSGWLAARRYLEERGHEILMQDEPFSFARSGPLVTAFPWEGSLGAEEETAIRAHLSRGEDLVVGYSGEQKQHSEVRLWRLLGMGLEHVRGDLPLEPMAWYRYRTEEWRLRPDDSLPADTRPVLIGATRWIPRAPAGARVLFRTPKGDAAVFILRFGGGRVFVLPSDAFSNARLSAAGNADVLESWARQLEGRIVFDEYHHGLSAPAAAQTGSGLAFDFLIGQLLLVYALGVTALSRRLGQPWRETPVRSGSTASFLMALAVRHRRLGHFRDAAKLLLVRLERLDPSWVPSAELLSAAGGADEKAFVEIAAAVSRRGRRTL